MSRWVIADGVETPTREQQLDRLRSETFDLLVIGGGATGAGIAVDAATRGLSCALVERDDFASGTSSKSTKLVHGGVRYLEKAVKNLDRSQLDLVRESLRERATVLKIAPNLTRAIPLYTPLYAWWEVPYYLVGLKLYDWLSGKRGLGSSRYASRAETLDKFPHLNPEGLKGAVVYYDGQFDDARLNALLAVSAAIHGAAVCNHLEVMDLLTDAGKIQGARVKDRLSGENLEVYARCIVNATGPYVDAVRKMAGLEGKPLVEASSGTHLLLSADLSPNSEVGLLIPRTSDGRVLFVLPWEGGTLVGTTDEKSDVVANPLPTKQEEQFILRQLDRYFDRPLNHSDVRASWTGLRPLVKGDREGGTADLVRDHYIEHAASGLITITGGKWTTFRKMAKEAVDEAIDRCHLSPVRKCQTAGLRIPGAVEDPSDYGQELSQRYRLPIDIAVHLAKAYGTRAEQLIKQAAAGGRERVHPRHPYVWAEVDYVIDHEYACTAVDVIARRIRLAFVDQRATIETLPHLVDYMGGKLNWDGRRRERELEQTMAYLGMEASQSNSLNAS